MAMEKNKRAEVVSRLKSAKVKAVILLPVVIRVAAVLAMVTAAVVMGLNRQSKSTAVAIVGTKTIFQTFTAKFQHTPAFVYFVIANAVAGFYNLLVLALRSLFKNKAYNIVVHLCDMVVTVLVATGAAAATSMAELGKNGNLHARWSPICDRFEPYCHRSGVALIASFVGVALLMILNTFSNVTLYKKATGGGLD